MAASLFGAGSDATASGLAFFVMAMCKSPFVLQQLRKEIDSICDSTHLPTFDPIAHPTSTQQYKKPCDGDPLVPEALLIS